MVSSIDCDSRAASHVPSDGAKCALNKFFYPSLLAVLFPLDSLKMTIITDLLSSFDNSHLKIQITFRTCTCACGVGKRRKKITVRAAVVMVVRKYDRQARDGRLVLKTDLGRDHGQVGKGVFKL